MADEKDALRAKIHTIVTETLAAATPPVPGAARLVIGSDHSGFALKEHLVRYLRTDLRLPFEDLGTHTPDSCDYPDIAAAVGRAIGSGRADRGILVDAAGVGSAMAANKIPGVRAALCHDLFTTRNSRLHNNANVLVLGSSVVSRAAARRLVHVWLTTEFEGGRHAKRVDKITALDGSR